MRRWFLTMVLAICCGRAAAAYTLHFSPNPALSGAGTTAILDYYDAYDGCQGAELKRVQGPQGVLRLELDPGFCGGGHVPNPQHSISAGLGDLAPGEYTVEIVESNMYPTEPFLSETLRVFAPPVCIPDTHRLCLQNGRFEVAVEWQDFSGNSGLGTGVPQDASNPIVPDSGFFWFFGPDNLELMVKVLDGCAINSRFWVFLSPATTVGLDIAVTDTKVGSTRQYSQTAGSVPGLTTDVDAFPCL